MNPEQLAGTRNPDGTYNVEVTGLRYAPRYGSRVVESYVVFVRSPKTGKQIEIAGDNYNRTVHIANDAERIAYNTEDGDGTPILRTMSVDTLKALYSARRA